MIDAAELKRLVEAAQQAAEAFEENGKPDDYFAAVRNGNRLKDFLLCYADEFLNLVDANRWQDISAAPKYGTVIWAIDRQRGYAAAVRYNLGEWECVTFQGTDMGVGFYPTHWRPLPKEPAQ